MTSTTTASPQVGERMIHHGHFHEIIEIRPKAVLNEKGNPVKVEMAVFDNERFRGVCRAEELRWSDQDDAWFLPGRILCHDERTVAAATMGMWPKAESHLMVRAMLDSVDTPLADHLSIDALDAVIRTRRLIRGFDKKTGLFLDGTGPTKGMTDEEITERREAAETEAEFTARVQAYREACLQHCEELRALRRGD